MLVLRKIDCYGQLLLAASMVFSSLGLLSGGVFLTGLFVLGWWQVLSAIFNTYSFIQCRFAHRIVRYWVFCLIDLALLFLSHWLERSGNILAVVLLIASLIGAFGVAIYYWCIYHRLIHFIFLRNELDGLTKSKH